MAKLAIFIDHDIIVRHFILSGVLPALESKHEVVYVFPDQPEQQKSVWVGEAPRKVRRVTADPASLPIKRFRTLSVSNERIHKYRRLYHATVLKKLRWTRDWYPIYMLWLRTLGYGLKPWTWKNGFTKSLLLSLPGFYEIYHWYTLNQVGESVALNTLMDEERPDTIIHPTVLEGPFVADLVRWGRAHSVPTIYLMNSWDNPGVKAMTIGYPDWLVAWGQQSQQIAHKRLGMPLDHILCFGAAQFDIYQQPCRESSSDYRKRLGIPDDDRVLLYAGSSKGLNETEHLVILEEAIERGDLPNCTVLYRPHPWRTTNKQERDFFAIQWRHVMIAPDLADYYRRTRRGEHAIYYEADYADTHVTLSAVDAVFSPLSTILLEAALHGKPIIAYLPDEGMSGDIAWIALMSMAKSVHFRDFFKKVDCMQCKHPQNLVQDCKRALDLAVNPEFGQRLKRQCEFFVSHTDRSYSMQLCDLVDAVVKTAADAAT